MCSGNLECLSLVGCRQCGCPDFDLRLQVIVALVLSLLAAIAICRAAQAQSPAQPLPPIVVETPKKAAPKAAPKAAAPKASPAPAAIG